MTAQSSDRSPWLPVALCAVPTVIGVLVSFLAAPGSGGDEVMREAQAVAFRAAFWPMLIGAAVSLFAAYRQLRGATVDPRWPQLLNAIAGGETAAVAAALRDAPEMAPELFRKLEGMQQRLTLDREVLREHRRTLESMAMTVTTLSEVAQQQGTEIESLAVALGAQGAAGSATTIDSLAHTAEESSSSVIEMVAINDEVRENIHNLALSVQETTTALEEMAFSSKEVARNIEELSTAAEETAASMNEMDVSIGQVETNANETSKISETVMRDAETGVSAINTTIRGIDKIKESSRVAAEVIGSLGQRISEIGNILNVIDDVAEQTNLLALNAAIIAAQAGEHGRGFAVVADEIKALAERTGASTKEIAGLIKTIQDESRRAVNVMSHGVEDVEEGVRLGHNAEEALRKIVDSAKRSTLMIQAIAQATVEQAKGSKQVTNAISRIAETVQQIAYASAEQAKGAEHIMQSAERMKMITQQVERSAEEQNRGGRQVTQAIERIREIAEEIDRAQQRQLRDAEGASRTVASQKLSSQRAVDGSQQASKLLGEAVRHLDRISGN